MFKLTISILITFLFAITFVNIATAGEQCVTSSQQEEVQETKLITTDVPSHLKGAIIIVILADGRKSAVPAEQFKLVPRKQQRIITKVATSTTKLCQQSADHKNRISLLAGRGTKSGLNKSVSPNRVDIESRIGAVGGLQYQRLLTEKISVGVQGQTNNTGSLMIGLDF
jgi:hypothetical protein